MLELYRAEGAFEALEEYLDSEGFWGRSGVVAYLYLGYGLSRALRRTGVDAPPEPCRLPLLACRIRPSGSRVAAGRPPRVGEWVRTWDDDSYAEAIEAVRSAIAR